MTSRKASLTHLEIDASEFFNSSRTLKHLLRSFDLNVLGLLYATHAVLPLEQFWSGVTQK